MLCSAAVQCSAVLCSAVQCRTVQCCAVQCCAVQCCAVLCSAVQCSAVQCSAVQCSAVLCCAVLCCAVLCSSVLCYAASAVLVLRCVALRYCVILSLLVCQCAVQSNALLFTHLQYSVHINKAVIVRLQGKVKQNTVGCPVQNDHFIRIQTNRKETNPRINGCCINHFSLCLMNPTALKSMLELEILPSLGQKNTK